MILMLLGNIGIASVIATVVLTLFTTAASEHKWLYVLLLLGVIAALVFLATSRRIERHMNRLILKGIKRWTRLRVLDYVAALQLQNGYAVGELKIESGDWLTGKTLSETALSKEGVLVLGIQRENDYIGAPRAHDRIQADDVLILYAAAERIAELDQRAAGTAGEQAHQQAVQEEEAKRQTL